MSRRKRGGHPLLALLIVLLLLVILALPWLYLRFSDFPYDDWEALADGNREPFDYADFSPEEGLTVRLDKADLYSLLREYAPPEKLTEQLPTLFGRKPEMEKLGFRLEPGEARISLRVKLGFLSFPLQLTGEVEAEGDGLRLTPRTVYLGPLVHISAAKLAEFAHQPGLADSLLISPGAYGAEGVTLRAGEDEVLLNLPVPPMLPDLLDLSVMRISRGLTLYGTEELPPAAKAAQGLGFTEAFRTAIAQGSARELLTSYLAIGEEGIAEILAEFTADIPEGYLPDPDETAAQRRAALEALAEGQRKYQTALETLRDLFRTGRLVPVPGGFQVSGRSVTLTDLGWTGAEPASWRPVYLCSFRSAHPAAQMALPDADPEALPEGGVSAADLGLVMPFPHGETLLLYRTAGNELVLIQLTEEIFRSLLESERTPTLLTDEFPQQERWLLTAAPAEDLMPVYFLLED